MRLFTILLWAVSVIALTVAAVVATAFVYMPTALDPTEMISAGTEPWIDAAAAILAFVGLLVSIALSLGLWHTLRFKAIGLGLAVLNVAAVGWACAKIYTDYF